MELREQLALLRRRWLTVVIVWVSALLLTGGITALMPTKYTATTQLFFGVQGGGSISDLSQGSNYVEQQMSSYVRVATSSLVLAPVIDKLDLQTNSRDLAKSVTASAPLDTVVLELSVTSPQADQAATIANAISAQLVTVAGDLSPESSNSAKPVRVTVLEPAVAPTSPSSPQILLNLAIGLALGLVLGVAVALVRSALSTRVSSSEDVESLTSAPVLGVVAFDPDSRHSRMVMRGDRSAIRSEGIRRLRTNLQFVDLSRGSRTIVVTSSVPSEGKTATLMNLGLSLADSGKRVLLIDADLRRPMLARQFGYANEPGLSDLLAGRSGYDETIREVAETTLDILPAGPTPPEPAELVGSAAMISILGQLTSKYDVMLIDSPPLLPVTDALALSKGADGALLVVGADRTRKQQVAEAVESLDTIGAHLVGLVLNKVSRRQLRGYAADDVAFDGWDVPGEPAVAEARKTSEATTR